MATETTITQDEALAAMLAGDLMTIPTLCKAVQDKWHVDEEDFLGLFPGDTDAFLLAGLPCRVLDLGGYKHILISPAAFDSYMTMLTDDGEDEGAA